MTPPRIRRAFFQRDPLTCARELIGCELRWGDCAGIIVETEAYAALDDEACHTFSRPSARRFIAEHPAGTAYVYFTYGMHWLLNVLVKDGAEDGFVLLRALEPGRGLAQMELRRRTSRITALCSGPGKLAQALGVTGSDHGRNLCAAGPVGFRLPRTPHDVIEAPRIGISRAAHLPWRFVLKNNPHVSVRPR